MEKSVVELFAGVGGFRVGLNNVRKIKNNGYANEKKTWNFVWANQFEPSTKAQDAYNCYKARFGAEGLDNRDIVEVVRDDIKCIPKHTLLVGGFPCQDYSVARSKSGEKGIEGKKGVLFWEIVKIINNKKTPFILLENVDRLLKSPASQRGRDFGIMLRTLADNNYNVEWRVINAADYGFPQRRRRVYIFAWKQSTKYNDILNKMDAENLLINEGVFAKTFKIYKKTTKKHCCDITKWKDTVEMTENFSKTFENAGIMMNGNVITCRTEPCKSKFKALKEILDNESDKSKFYLTDTQIAKFKELRYKKNVLRYKPNGEEYYYSEGSMSPYDNLDLPGRTMLTSESSVNRSTHIIMDTANNKLRFITPIEAERMQCFPDGWTDTDMSIKRRYFMMGNALVTGIIHKLEPILSQIVEEE